MAATCDVCFDEASKHGGGLVVEVRDGVRHYGRKPGKPKGKQPAVTSVPSFCMEVMLSVQPVR